MIVKESLDCCSGIYILRHLKESKKKSLVFFISLKKFLFIEEKENTKETRVPGENLHHAEKEKKKKKPITEKLKRFFFDHDPRRVLVFNL